MQRMISAGVVAIFSGLLPLAAIQAQQAPKAPPPVSKEAVVQPVERQEPDIATLEKMSQDAYEAEKWVSYYGANIRMMNQRPYEPLYMQRVIAACALLERRKTAYHYMLKMQQQGLSYDLREDPDTVNIRNTELFDYLTELMVEAGQPAGQTQTIGSLKGEYSDPLSVSWDQGRESFLVGTRSSGAIVSVALDGTQEVLMKANDKNGLWAITGLHADAGTNRLWVSSAAIPGFAAFKPTDLGRGALFEFNLETLEQLNRFDVPVDGFPHEPGPLAVSAAGDVYIVDRATPLVFRKAVNGEALELFAGSAEMDSVQGIAVSPDNRRLFVADRYKGILVIDPEERSSVMLTGPDTLNLGQISGLAYGQEKLFIVQSGIRPERVMQLELDEMGSNVTNATPMASALESFDHPGLGLYREGFVYFFDNLGDPGESEKQEAVRLVRTSLVSPEARPAFELDANPETQDSD